MRLPIQTRSKPPEDKLPRRDVVLLTGRGAPSTLDEAARTVEVVVATEQPVRVYDWRRDMVINEVLLLSGLKPLPRQVPFLDTHSRWSMADMLGSLRDFRTEGDQVLATAHFSESAEQAWTLAREGHLTDVSVGYQVEKFVWVEEGKTAKVDGRDFTGPVRVVTRWRIKEVSAVPIGADDKAKVRAQADSPKQEEGTMDPKLRKFLESRGLAKDATEQEAWEFLERMELPREPENPTDPPPDASQRQAAAGDPPNQDDDAVQQAAREAAIAAVRAEQERIFEIRAMCRQHGLPDDQVDQMISDSLTVDQARAKVLEHLSQAGAQTQGGAGYRGPVEFGADATDKFRAAARDAIMLRAGVEVAEPAEGADSELRGYTLLEMARECLRRATPTARIPWNPLELVGRAITTSDLPYILGNIANKSLLVGWDEAEETWPLWMATGSVNDFKTHTAVGEGEFDDLEEVKEEGEYKYGKPAEHFEQYAIATYGKLFAISRQAIINDDLNVLTDRPAHMGRAAARKVGDVAYAVVTANATMGDGIALFASAHNNLLTAAALSKDSLGAALKAMALQKGPNNKATLNIQAKYVIAPVALQSDHETFFNTTRIGETSGTIYDNPYAGNKLTRVYEPRLDDDSATAWYLAGAKGKTIKVFFLNGVQKPYTESKEGWTVDGVEYKVRIDAGAKAMGWRPLSKNPGQ
jgi:hypothetical protein